MYQFPSSPRRPSRTNIAPSHPFILYTSLIRSQKAQNPNHPLKNAPSSPETLLASSRTMPDQPSLPVTSDKGMYLPNLPNLPQPLPRPSKPSLHHNKASPIQKKKTSRKYKKKETNKHRSLGQPHHQRILPPRPPHPRALPPRHTQQIPPPGALHALPIPLGPLRHPSPQDPLPGGAVPGASVREAL